MTYLQPAAAGGPPPAGALIRESGAEFQVATEAYGNPELFRAEEPEPSRLKVYRYAAMSIGLMVAAAGHISGGVYNPSLTIALVAARRIGVTRGAYYIVAQLVGATLAALALKAVFPAAMASAVNLGTPAVGPGVGTLAALHPGRLIRVRGSKQCAYGEQTRDEARDGYHLEIKQALA